MATSDDARLSMLREYASGDLSRKELQEATGMWFGDILAEMSRYGLTLPRVDSRALLTDEQKTLFAELVG